MKHLEHEIDALEALDNLRIESAELRDQGRASLRQGAVGKGSWDEEGEWGDAHVIKALCSRREGPSPVLAKLVSKLKIQTAKKILNYKRLQRPEELPFFRAARSMQALAAAPDSGFCEPLLTFYYQIVREIYTADTPDWSVGGVHAAEGGSASAYITGECVRAILSFARTLENTATFIDEVSSLRARKAQIEAVAKYSVPEWREVDLHRLRRDLYSSVVPLLDNIALDLEPKSNPPLKPDNILNFLDEVPNSIAVSVSKVAKTFKAVEKAIIEYRTRELSKANQSSATRRYERSATGHAVGLGAIEQGLHTATEAAELFHDSALNTATALDKLANKFRSASEEVKRLIRPARAFLSTVLDRELTAESSEARPGWDPAEMAFAAASYGYAADNWDDDRLRRAGHCLSQELSERGRFRSGRPFYVDSDSSENYMVLGAEILRAFAQLLENVEEIPIDARLINRMMLFLKDTRRDFQDPPHVYWCHEQEREPPQAYRWVTAVSVLALDRINRMLDARINARVFRYFSVQREKHLKAAPLRNLFYPDYGLTASGGRKESVALALERLRTHVLGLSGRERPGERLFSLILHGPPGTGKTTMVKALAKSAGVTFVEVTPSDIVSSGAEGVERRARAVFKALSLLTRVVILFDEFDPVLRRRKRGDSESSTIFSFVTPGMLPKLQHLHDMAERRSVAYVLVTNLIGTLDPAAVRSGRFDCELGVYPPDPLSREGRLLDEVLAFQQADYQLPSDFRKRIRKVVQMTPGAPMGDLSREGWFRRPDDLDAVPGSPFEYLVKEDSDLIFESPQPEATPERPPRCKEKKCRAAEQEYQEWVWIRDWDEKLTRARSDRELQMALQIPRYEQETPSEQGHEIKAKRPRRSGPNRRSFFRPSRDGHTGRTELPSEAPVPSPR